MSSVLESVEWGEPALSLLSQIKDIDISNSTIMLIRHSERLPGFYATLTDTGKQASYEYGKQITQFKHVNLYHTYLERTKETAQEIQKALLDNGTTTKMGFQVNLRTVNNQKRYSEYMFPILNAFGLDEFPTPEQQKELTRRPDNPPKRNFLKWVSGHYSPLSVRPSLDFVQQLTALLMVNLEESRRGVLDLYVCHDTWIAALLLHWFGIMPEIWINYLEGIVIQPMKENLRAVLPQGPINVPYPFWWKV
jgi:broad specificity phosphatase PhoE